MFRGLDRGSNVYNDVYVVRMVRKQVYITVEQDEKLKRLAEARGQTEAEVMRHALDGVSEVSYSAGQMSISEGRLQEAAAVMDRYVVNSQGIDEAGSVRTFAGRRLDDRAWAEEIAFIKSLVKATRGTTDRFDRDELYEERESKLLR